MKRMMKFINLSASQCKQLGGIADKDKKSHFKVGETVINLSDGSLMQVTEEFLNSVDTRLGVYWLNMSLISSDNSLTIDLLNLDSVNEGMERLNKQRDAVLTKINQNILLKIFPEINDSETICYFAYGSNMSNNRLSVRGIKPTKSFGGQIKGYELKINKQSSFNQTLGFANIEPNMNSSVEGVLHYITKGELKRLDKFEGAPENCYRMEIMATNAYGARIKAITHVANKNYTKDNLSPCPSYMKFLMEGKEWLSKEYFRKLSLLYSQALSVN